MRTEPSLCCAVLVSSLAAAQAFPPSWFVSLLLLPAPLIDGPTVAPSDETFKVWSDQEEDEGTKTI